LEPLYAQLHKDLPVSTTSNLAKQGASAEDWPVGAREEHLARNEALFREVNERVAEVAKHFIEVETRGEQIAFTCECARRACAKQIEMTVVEYEAIRADSTRFAVAPDHEQPEIETVVERHSTYWVVEKRDEDAREVASETDPRE
jgi:hypothetical protein